MSNYGMELILDLHNCDPATFTRDNIEQFFSAVCEATAMTPEDLHFWDYVDYPEDYENAPDHLKGTTAVQFIQTSNITIHTLEVLKKAYINFFSCKIFASEKVEKLSLMYFKGEIVNSTIIERY